MANWRGPGQLQRALFVNSDNTQTREHMAGAASTRAGQKAGDARRSEGGADDSWTLSLPNNQTTKQPNNDSDNNKRDKQSVCFHFGKRESAQRVGLSSEQAFEYPYLPNWMQK